MKGVSRSIGIRPFCSVLAGLALTAFTANAQEPIRDALVVGGDNFLFGVGALPGVGLQGTYLAPGRMYTREALLFGSVVPRGSEGSVHVAVAIGGALRIVGALEAVGMSRPRRFDVHVGVRVGPGLRFGFEEVRADRNQRFNLVFEPFIRYTRDIGRRLYVEVGLARPSLRVGVMVAGSARTPGSP